MLATLARIAVLLGLLAPVVCQCVANRAPRLKYQITPKPTPLPFFIEAILALALIFWASGYYAWKLPIAFNSPHWLQVAGGVIYFLGGALNGWCRIALGRSRVPGIGLMQNHKLVRHGPYKCVRHPMYTSYWLMTIGTLALSGPAFLTVMSAVVAAAYSARIAPEEALMKKAFSKQYTRYEAATPGKIVPRHR